MINPKDFRIEGLSDEAVLRSRKTHGKNTLDYKRENSFLDALKSILLEPMVILLAVASGIYFISGNVGDGVFLALAIVLVASISLYQDSRSRKALEKLKNLTQPNSKVVRNGAVIEIPSEELVIGDSLMVEEGNIVPADGTIQHSNDFSVNESLLTGESLSVFKDVTKSDNRIFTGTTVASGLAIATVSAIGNSTELGKIGKSLEGIKEEKTPLERQISNFVKKMSIWGGIAFCAGLGHQLLQILRPTRQLAQGPYLGDEHSARGNSRSLYHLYGFGRLAVDENGYRGQTDEDRGEPGKCDRNLR